MSVNVCTVSGTIYRATGEPASRVHVYVRRVVKNGFLISTEDKSVRSENDGTFEIVVPRNSTVYFESECEGLNVEGGVAYPIPDAATANLEDLLPSGNVPTQGILVKHDDEPLPTLITSLNFAGAVEVEQSGGGAATVTVLSGVNAYLHTQSVAATIWTVNHNLGYRPSVELFDTGGAEIDAEVLHTSVNQTLVYFNTAVAGSARAI